MNGINLDINGDCILENGIIEICEAYGQAIENLLHANRGEFKEAPLIGGETDRMRGGIIDPMWCGNTRNQLESVGIPVSRVEMKDNQIIVT